MVMCHSFAHKYSVDAKVLLERVAKEISGEHALQLISRIREMLMKNDEMLNEISKKLMLSLEQSFAVLTKGGLDSTLESRTLFMRGSI